LWRVAAFMNRIFPRFSVRVLKHAHEKDASAGVEQDNDPLAHTRGTARLAMEVRAVTGRLRSEASSLALPLLLFHGTDDQIASVEGSRTLIRLVKGETTYREFPGAGHEVFVEELTRDAAFAALRDWLVNRIARGPETPAAEREIA
jgi:alpha-beta hydrolase superfamily lysophospholipase